MSPNLLFIRKRISLQLRCKFSARLRTKTYSTQQAWMYSRNQTTITSRCKHRQPVFLHPTEECSGVDCEALEIAPRLPIPSLSSTLHVFQFIPWNPVEFSRRLATVHKHWAKD
ncbi:MAG: hypothetical protein DMG79_14635 [Acidobacteria bacterium]|nr:MAG: hypothetical protein DMG79_14635 [Acidobacteriota bacterium]